MKDKYKLLIGERTAEMIKKDVVTVFPGAKKEVCEVKGRDLVTGLPHSIEVKSSEMEEALRESVYVIVSAAKNVLEQTPPELASDIIDRGVIITGGGALLHGLDMLLTEELKVPVFLADEPLDAVAKGCGIMLDNIHLLGK
jgi:rod shape-determining protein MreB